MSDDDVDLRDLRGRIGRLVVAALIAVGVTRLAIGGVELLTGERSRSLASGSTGLATLGVFAGAVFVVAWAIAFAALAAVARRRARRGAPPIPRAGLHPRR